MHVVRQVVDQRQAGAGVVHVGLRGIAIDRLEVDVVDADVADAAVALLAAPAVHQIDERVADALDGRDVQLHRAAMRVEPHAPSSSARL